MWLLVLASLSDGGLCDLQPFLLPRSSAAAACSFALPPKQTGDGRQGGRGEEDISDNFFLCIPLYVLSPAAAAVGSANALWRS